MSRAIEQPDRSGGFRVEGIPELSQKAADFLRRRPRKARMAVAAALETAAAQDAQPAGKPRRSSSTEIPEKLKPFLVSRPRSPDMLYAAQAAERLDLATSTVYSWVDRKKLLGWKPPGRHMKIPAGQILGPRKVVPGLAAIVDIIGSPVLTWAFLSQEWPFENDIAYPLEKLKNGQVEEVLAAAPAFGTTFT